MYFFNKKWRILKIFLILIVFIVTIPLIYYYFGSKDKIFIPSQFINQKTYLGMDWKEIEKNAQLYNDMFDPFAFGNFFTYKGYSAYFDVSGENGYIMYNFDFFYKVKTITLTNWSKKNSIIEKNKLSTVFRICFEQFGKGYKIYKDNSNHWFIIKWEIHGGYVYLKISRNFIFKNKNYIQDNDNLNNNIIYQFILSRNEKFLNIKYIDIKVSDLGL
jgi:hypothetical protein